MERNHIAEEGIVSADELFDAIMAGFAELQAFEDGKILRVTEIVDGERLPPTEITSAELQARQTARAVKAKSAQNGSAWHSRRNTSRESCYKRKAGLMNQAPTT